MPLTSIVAVVLRAFSVLWLIQGLAALASVLAVLESSPLAGSNLLMCAAPALLLLAAVFTFVFARPFAGVLTPQPDSTVQLGGLSPYDLYCFAFTLVGLYFVLSSLGSVLNWLHYYAMIGRTIPEGDPTRESHLYQFTQPLVTLLAGGVSLLFASSAARKLLRLHEVK